MPKLKYKRVLLKLSGEVFGGDNGSGFDDKVVKGLCEEIADLKKMGASIGIVIGGGNIWRFRDHVSSGLDRVQSDTMGMLATIMNALYLQGMLAQMKVKSRVCSAIEAQGIVENYYPVKGLKDINDGVVLILPGGTGSPFFTTDSAAALRALELKCDIFLKATKVDFVYDRDPMKHKDAKAFKCLKYDEVLAQDLNVIDMTAISLCKEGKMPILVFDLTKKGNIIRAAQGKNIGTIIS